MSTTKTGRIYVLGVIDIHCKVFLLGCVKLESISFGYGKGNFPATSLLSRFYQQQKVNNFYYSENIPRHGQSL